MSLEEYNDLKDFVMRTSYKPGDVYKTKIDNKNYIVEVRNTDSGNNEINIHFSVFTENK